MNDIAVGIALMLFGTGLAFFFGKPFIQPQAPHAAGHSARRLEPSSPQIAGALQVNPLFFVGIAARRSRWPGRSATPAGA